MLGQALLALKRYDEVLAEMRVALELDHASVRRAGAQGRGAAPQGRRPRRASRCWQSCAVQGVGRFARRGAARRGRAAGRSARRRCSASHPAVGFVGTGRSRVRRRSGHEELPGVPGRRRERPTSTAPRTPAASTPGRPRWPRPARSSGRPVAGVEPRTRRRRRRSSRSAIARGPSRSIPSSRASSCAARMTSARSSVRPSRRSLLALGDVAVRDGPRGSITASTRHPGRPPPQRRRSASKPRRASMFKDEVSTVELDDDGDARGRRDAVGLRSRGADAARKLVPGPADRGAQRREDALGSARSRLPAAPPPRGPPRCRSPCSRSRRTSRS